MRNRGIVLMTLVAPMLIGCKGQSADERPFSAQELVGEYDYYRDNVTAKPVGTSCFTLRVDGTFSSGTSDFTSADGPILPKTGHWMLSSNSQGPILDLAHAGFPLERRRSSIRALVNDDTGMFCQLAK